MKAISVRGGWAWAIARAGKRVENRTWATKLRGWVAIHASASKGGDSGLRAILDQLGIEPPDEYPRGAIVAVAWLADCLDVDDPALGVDPWAEGPVCWVLREVRPLATPVACKGRLGLWDVPPDVAREVNAQAAAGEAERAAYNGTVTMGGQGRLW